MLFIFVFATVIAVIGGPQGPLIVGGVMITFCGILSLGSQIDYIRYKKMGVSDFFIRDIYAQRNDCAKLAAFGVVLLIIGKFL